MLRIPINIEEYRNYTKEQLLECHKYSFERLKKIDAIIPKEYHDILMNVPQRDLEYIELVLKSRKIAIPNYNSLIWRIRDNKYVKGISFLIFFAFILSIPSLL